MHLVDKEDDIAFSGNHFAQNGFQALLEFAAIFRARDKRAHIERQQLLVEEGVRHVAIDDAQRKPLGDRGLADARLADEDRIVLRATRQNLDRAADLLVASDDGIELTLASDLGQVACIFLQRVIGILGRGGIRGASLPQILDRAVEGLRADAGIGENLPGLGALVHRQCKQEPLDGHKGIARLLGDFLGRIEETRCGRREIDLASAAALYFRQFGERDLGLHERLARAAPARSIRPDASPSGSSSRTFRTCSGRNCW